MEETKVYEVRETIADPSTLGLASFALALFVLSFYNAGIIGANSMFIIVPLALLTAWIHFMVASFGFRKNELFTAVVFGTYGMFWAIYGLLQIGLAAKLFTFDAPSFMIYCIAFTIFTFYVFIATLVTNKAVIYTIFLLLVVFVLLDFGLAGNPTFVVWAGYVGIVCALMAFYTSAAGLLGGLYGRSILPVGPVKTKSS